MPGDSVDAFLNIIKRRINNDELYDDVEVEFNKFRQGRAPYDSGLFICIYYYLILILSYTDTIIQTHTIL